MLQQKFTPSPSTWSSTSLTSLRLSERRSRSSSSVNICTDKNKTYTFMSSEVITKLVVRSGEKAASNTINGDGSGSGASGDRDSTYVLTFRNFPSVPNVEAPELGGWQKVIFTEMRVVQREMSIRGVVAIAGSLWGKRKNTQMVVSVSLDEWANDIPVACTEVVEEETSTDPAWIKLQFNLPCDRNSAFIASVDKLFTSESTLETCHVQFRAKFHNSQGDWTVPMSACKLALPTRASNQDIMDLTETALKNFCLSPRASPQPSLSIRSSVPSLGLSPQSSRKSSRRSSTVSPRAAKWCTSRRAGHSDESSDSDDSEGSSLPTGYAPPVTSYFMPYSVSSVLTMGLASGRL
ncbi:hypothetical protein DFJ77DRAFT_475782 [Powellomyces hirtus]|nr:hypothetical protein DFJ77DRAFT_475782 [Powellomyces hirtus]